jgi:O-antigen/teichoic acid export membrane protein
MLRKIIATLFTKGFVAIVNLAILLISSKQLGGDIRGQISLLLLNIAIIQAVNEIFTGYALVYFIPNTNVKNIYKSGVLWTLLVTAIMNFAFLGFKIGLKEQAIHVYILSVIIILHSFHGVVILAKEKIKIYNFLNFFQPALLLISLCICVFLFQMQDVRSYIVALYISFVSSISISLVVMIGVLRDEKKIVQRTIHFLDIFKNGFYNQLANLSHMLSNRYNFYLLASTVFVGIYSSSISLVESILIISNSASTIILTHTANQSDEGLKVKLTFLLSKICFLLSLICVFFLFFIPTEFFTFLLGKDFSQTKEVMMHLTPGVLFVSFSTVISHYFSGKGKQKLIAAANLSGLFITLCTSYFLISNYQLIGACYAASISYFVSSLILVIAFVSQHKISLSHFFKIKSELHLLKKVK